MDVGKQSLYREITNKYENNTENIYCTLFVWPLCVCARAEQWQYTTADIPMAL